MVSAHCEVPSHLRSATSGVRQFLSLGRRDACLPSISNCLRRLVPNTRSDPSPSVSESPSSPAALLDAGLCCPPPSLNAMGAQTTFTMRSSWECRRWHDEEAAQVSCWVQARRSVMFVPQTAPPEQLPQWATKAVACPTSLPIPAASTTRALGSDLHVYRCKARGGADIGAATTAAAPATSGFAERRRLHRRRTQAMDWVGRQRSTAGALRHRGVLKRRWSAGDPEERGPAAQSTHIGHAHSSRSTEEEQRSIAGDGPRVPGMGRSRIQTERAPHTARIWTSLCSLKHHIGFFGCLSEPTCHRQNNEFAAASWKVSTPPASRHMSSTGCARRPCLVRTDSGLVMASPAPKHDNNDDIVLPQVVQ